MSVGLNSSIIFLIIFISYKITSVNLIVVPTRVPRYENSKNRDLINILARIKPKTSSCINKFVSDFVNQQPFRISIFLTKFCDVDLSNIYLSKILDEHPKYIRSDDEYTDNERSSNILVILHDHQCLKNTSYNFLSLCTGKCFYIVFLTKYFNDKKSFMQETEDVVKILWSRKIGNVVILGEMQNIVWLMKSQTFKPILLREPSKPVQIGECDQLARWGDLKDVRDTIQMDNSLINVAYFNREPYVKIPTPDNENFSGIETSLINVLAKNLKMSINLSEIEWSNGTDFMDEINEEFESDRAIDLIIGGMLWNPTELMDFTEPYEVVQIVWLVPVHANISLRGLVTPFDISVWYAIGAVLLFAIILKYFIFHKLTFLEILALIMGYSWPKQPTRDSYRINYISWVIFGFLLTQYYLASLAGQLMAQSELQIETMVDLIDSGFSYGGLKSHHMMLGNPDSEDNVIKTLSNNFVVFEKDDYEKLFNDLIYGKNNSFALSVTLNMSAIGTKWNHNNVHKMNEILTSAPIAFPVWKGLPYLSSIDRTLMRLVQSGIIQHLASVAAISENVHFTDNNILDSFIDSEDLAPAFLLLVIGLTAGFTCLLFEIVVSFWMKKKKKSKKRKNFSLKIKKNNSRKKRIRRFERNPILKRNDLIGYPHGYKILWKEI